MWRLVVSKSDWFEGVFQFIREWKLISMSDEEHEYVLTNDQAKEIINFVEDVIEFTLNYFAQNNEQNDVEMILELNEETVYFEVKDVWGTHTLVLEKM